MNEPKDFRELVAVCCWMVIEGITKGEPLNRVMFGVLMYAREWKLPQEDRNGRQPQDALHDPRHERIA